MMMMMMKWIETQYQSLLCWTFQVDISEVKSWMQFFLSLPIITLKVKLSCEQLLWCCLCE